MQPLIIIILFLLIPNSSIADNGWDNKDLTLQNTPHSAKSPKSILDAAIERKKAHVGREWENCLIKAPSEAVCKKLLGIIWEREKKVLARLSPALSNPDINLDRLIHEFNSCSSPNNTYTNLVDCWEGLANRLDAAFDGNLLLKKESVCK